MDYPAPKSDVPSPSSGHMYGMYGATCIYFIHAAKVSHKKGTER